MEENKRPESILAEDTEIVETDALKGEAEPPKPKKDKKTVKIDPKEFHKEYLDWKKESKGGKVPYYLKNVLLTGVVASTVFALLMVGYNLWGYQWLGHAQGYSVSHTIWYVIAFLLIYLALLFVIYGLSWKNNEKKFAEYDRAVMSLVAKNEAAKQEETPSDPSLEEPSNQAEPSSEE